MKKILKSIVIKIIELQARLVLRIHRPYVIAITGNVGKTSAKEAVFYVISSGHHTRKSQKSFNSEIGVPLTILGCPTGWSDPLIWIKNIMKGFKVIAFSRKYPDYLVLEIGADHPGDIKKVCKWLSPDVGIVTAVGEIPVHIEAFSSREELVVEKGELIKSLSSEGKAILNVDEEDVANMRNLFDGRPIFYGFSGNADICASHYQYTYDDRGRVKGFHFKVDNNGSSLPLYFEGFLGRQHVYAILAGVSAGISEGMNMVSIQEALVEYHAEPGRMRILDGLNGSTLIDDTYNASPVAVKVALKELEGIEIKGRKIAVLGDMLELGKHTHKEHEKAGRQALEVCDIVVSVGARSRVIAELDDKDKVIHFPDSIEASRNFPLEIEEGDVILIKGSQSVRMERVTESLLKEPKRASELLVRQESFWKKK